MLDMKLTVFLLCLCLEIIFKLLLQAIELDFLRDKFLPFFFTLICCYLVNRFR